MKISSKKYIKEIQTKDFGEKKERFPAGKRKI